MKGKFTLAAAVFLGMVMFSAAGDTAKKLVGVWQVTKQEGQPAPVGKQKVILEFTADGKYSMNETSEKGDKETQEGKYAVKGETITITVKAGEKERSPMTAKIKKLTESELHIVVVEPDGKASGVMFLKRVKK